MTHHKELTGTHYGRCYGGNGLCPMALRGRPVPEWLTFSQVWARSGRATKRCLSKARRRYAREVVRFGRGREPASLESNCNYKDW